MRAVFAAAGLFVAFLFPAIGQASPKLPDDPVAVLPFKNLNQDPALDWLRIGIAETMISDLKKSSKVRVVERDQIDRALTELALQDKNTAGDEVEQVKAGKMVGARTLVIGSFQQSGSSLRINARFVAVETGVVLDTAKTTGPSTRVFSLQDQVVDQLLGTAPATRPRRKDSQKTLDAYRLYAMALAVSSDADRVGYLKQSLALDPDFVYAADDLAALEDRIGRYASVRKSRLPAAEERLWARFSDESLAPTERAIALSQLFIRMDNDRRFRAVLDAAARVEAMHIQFPPPNENPTAFVRAESFQAYLRLKQPDLAMQAGDSFLKDFPDDPWFPTVESQMHTLIDQRRRLPEAQKRLADSLGRIEAQRTQMIADWKSITARADDPQHYSADLRRKLSGLDLARCTACGNSDSANWEQALTECRKFAAEYSSDSDPFLAGEVIASDYNEIRALGELGRWEQAIPRATAFLAAHAADSADSAPYVMTTQLRSQMGSWPADAVPDSR